MSFHHIIGHEKVKKQISTSIESGKLSHAHLLFGENGIGKRVLAKAIALKILGKHKDKQYVDILEWKSEKSSIGVKSVREMIAEINKKPYESDKKIVIIYEAHKMTSQAQNAFLKTIEEPPKGVYIILLCENIEMMLDTIKSRCQIHKLKGLNQEEMKEFLKRKYDFLEEEQVQVMVAFSHGIPGRAEKFIENNQFNDMRTSMLDLLFKIITKSIEEILAYETILVKYQEQALEALDILLYYIRDVMIYKEVGKENFIVNVDKIASIKQLINQFSFNQLNDMIKVVNETRENLDRNINPSLAFNMMLLKMQEV